MALEQTNSKVTAYQALLTKIYQELSGYYITYDHKGECLFSQLLIYKKP